MLPHMNLSTWKLADLTGNFRGLKIDGIILYLTIEEINQIFLCNPSDGKILNLYGTINRGSQPGEFTYPFGITVNNKYVYICDNENHRIQILNKENGKFSHQWGSGERSWEKGQFMYPYSIYRDLEEDIFYVGDGCSVQLFTKENICLQRIGDTTPGKRRNQFDSVESTCVVYDRLYISDSGNERIQIYKYCFILLLLWECGMEHYRRDR